MKEQDNTDYTIKGVIRHISRAITVLEACQTYEEENFTARDQENLDVLNFCYDLITRTEEVSEMVVEVDEEMKEKGFEEDFMRQYGQVADDFVDFVFTLVTGKGRIDMRKMLRRFVPSYQKTAKSVGVRKATISDYMNKKNALSSDTFEAILNVFAKKKRAKNTPKLDE
jgi:hypothetical protein